MSYHNHTKSIVTRNYSKVEYNFMFPNVFILSATDDTFCRSPVFAAMFTSPCTESSVGVLKLSDTKYDTANAAIGCIYTSEIRGDYDIEVSVKLDNSLTEYFSRYIHRLH